MAAAPLTSVRGMAGDLSPGHAAPTAAC
jgi:hypothetical protein